MAYAQVSGTCGSDTVWVRLPSSAPSAKTAFLLVFAFLKAKSYALTFVFAVSRDQTKMLKHFVATFVFYF